MKKRSFFTRQTRIKNRIIYSFTIKLSTITFMHKRFLR